MIRCDKYIILFDIVWMCCFFVWANPGFGGDMFFFNVAMENHHVEFTVNHDVYHRTKWTMAFISMLNNQRVVQF